MSDIKSKIKELEKLQKKVDYLKQVIDFPTKLKAADADEKEVLPEVCKLVEDLLNPIIENLELGNSETIGALGVISEKTPFTEEDVTLIKKLIERVKHPSTRVEQPIKEGPKPKPKVDDANVAWAKENQHLGGKRVKTLILSGEVEGEVIKLNKPFVVIKLDNGKIHQSTLDKIKVLDK